MLLSNCAICGKKKSTFIKNKKLHNFNDQLKANKIISKFLLTRIKFMSELHLKQPGFIYSVCGKFTKQCESIQKLIETGHLKQFIQK